MLRVLDPSHASREDGAVKQKGRRIAMMIGAISVVVLGISAFLLRRGLVEGYYLRKLDSPSAADRVAATRELGRLRSLRAIPAFRSHLGDPGTGVREEILNACKVIGPQAAPVLFDAMEKAWKKQDFRLASVIAGTLADMGPASEVGKYSENFTLRSEFANALAEKGRSEEALSEYLWCFDHPGGSDNPVRLSFLLGHIGELGTKYPPAFDALRGRRDRDEEGLREASPDTGPPTSDQIFDEVLELRALNRELKEPERMLRLFLDLKGTERGERVRKEMLTFVMDPLLEEGSYTQILDVSDGFPETSRWIAQLMLLRLIDRKFARGYDSTIRNAGKFYHALLGAGRTEKADELARMILGGSTNIETYTILARRAYMAGKADRAEALIEEASQKLGQDSAEQVRKAALKPEEEPSARRG
jgi:hypothetical protein